MFGAKDLRSVFFIINNISICVSTKVDLLSKNFDEKGNNIVAPKKGDRLTAGETFKIEWLSPVGSQLAIYYSALDDETNSATRALGVYGNPGFATWDVPTIEEGFYQFIIRQQNSNQVYNDYTGLGISQPFVIQRSQPNTTQPSESHITLLTSTSTTVITETIWPTSIESTIDYYGSTVYYLAASSEVTSRTSLSIQYVTTTVSKTTSSISQTTSVPVMTDATTSLSEKSAYPTIVQTKTNGDLPPENASPAQSQSSTNIIVGSVIGSAVFLAILGAVGIWLILRRRYQSPSGRTYSTIPNPTFPITYQKFLFRLKIDKGTSAESDFIETSDPEFIPKPRTNA